MAINNNEGEGGASSMGTYEMLGAHNSQMQMGQPQGQRQQHQFGHEGHLANGGRQQQIGGNDDQNRRNLMMHLILGKSK
jgi:hypothetical protein